MTYEAKIQLLAQLDELSIKIARFILKSDKLTPTENFLSHVLNTIHPANELLVWGLRENKSLAINNGLRTLLENWANCSYVLKDPQMTATYTELIEKIAMQYALAQDALRKDPTLGMQLLKKIPRWTRSGPTDRVRILGEGPEYQYDLLSRYTHADVWTVANDYLIKDRETYNSIMLTWGIEFVNHTIWAITTNATIAAELSDDYTKLNLRVAKMLKDQQ